MSISGFHVTVASDLDHERLIAEIYVGDVFVALVSEEQPGRQLLEIGDAADVKVDPAVFMLALQQAMAALDRLG